MKKTDTARMLAVLIEIRDLLKKPEAKLPLPANELLSIGDVLRYLPFSRAHWYREMAAGKAPRPIKKGSRSVWHSKDIRHYIDRTHRLRA